MPVLLKLIAWMAGTEIATNVVVTKVLAQRLGILLNRVELGGTFVQVWKRFRKEGFSSCQGTSVVALVSARSLTRGLNRQSQLLATWASRGPSNAFWELPSGDRAQVDSPLLEKALLVKARKARLPASLEPRFSFSGPRAIGGLEHGHGGHSPTAW